MKLQSSEQQQNILKLIERYQHFEIFRMNAEKIIREGLRRDNIDYLDWAASLPTFEDRQLRLKQLKKQDDEKKKKLF